jgi:hypothetical protein
MVLRSGFFSFHSASLIAPASIDAARAVALAPSDATTIHKSTLKGLANRFNPTSISTVKSPGEGRGFGRLFTSC